MNRHLLLLSCLLAAVSLAASAQQLIPLYDGPAPGTEKLTHEEKEYYSPLFRTEVVTNVTKPTLTAFLPDPAKATGTAVVIAPGGGFHALSINSEGNDVAKWLAERGVAGFVLRYRLVPTGEDGVKEMMEKSKEVGRVMKDMAEVAPFAGADGLAAVKYVRDHAAEFHVTPDRIGFMGFSAGGAVTMIVGTGYDATNKPNFIAPIYAGLGMMKDASVPADAPPAFIVAATDDQLDLAKDSVAIYSKWLAAKKPAEMHLYAKGGHGFGMRKQDLPTDQWIERFGEWLELQGLLKPVG